MTRPGTFGFHRAIWPATLKDPDYFAYVIVDHGTVAWPNGLDLDPPVFHGDFEPAPRLQHAGPQVGHFGERRGSAKSDPTF
jgi:hypothetical protein